MLSRISERVYTRCPYGKAPSYLNYYLDELSRKAGGTSILRLEVPVADLALGIPVNATLSRDVIVHFAPADGDKFGAQQTDIEWEPEGGGPFPNFRGSIVIEADEDYGRSSIMLKGSYKPPLGVVGLAFDAAVAKKIARATAHQLLLTLRRRLEAEHVASQRSAQ